MLVQSAASLKLASTTEDAGSTSGQRSAQANWVLFLLTVASTLNFLDRSVISVLLDLIKRELMLSDTMLGLIAGFGFALVYALLGVPFARLADVTSRRAVIAGGVLVWSLMTALGGLARSGMDLVLVRVGVGAGEAAGTAASHAMLSENFDKDERPRALSILNLGMPIGIFLGVMIGGWVGGRYGWRAALFVCGFPGVIIAALLLLTTSDSRPRAGRHDDDAGDAARSLWSSLSFLLRQRSFSLTITAAFFSGFGIYGLFIWMPTFFSRVYAMPLAAVGTWVGGVMGLSGVFGVFAGGWVVTRFGRGDDRWKPGQPAIACLMSMPFLVGMLFMPSWQGALLMMGIGSALLQSHLGPIYSIYQAVSPPRMRSVATSVHNLIASIGGLGLSALLVGMISDHLRPVYGETAIRYALIPSFLCLLPAAVFYFLASRHIRRDIAQIT